MNESQIVQSIVQIVGTISENEKLKKYLETLVNGDPFRLKNLEDL